MTHTIEITAYFEKGPFGARERCQFIFYVDLPDWSDDKDYGTFAADRARMNKQVKLIEALDWHLARTESVLSGTRYRDCLIYKNFNVGVTKQAKFHWRADLLNTSACGKGDTIDECREAINTWWNEGDE